MAVSNVLIVLAHPDPGSYNAALAGVAAETLRARSAEVVISDLYALGFEAVAGRGDMTDAAAEGLFNLALEQGRALEAGTLASDILAEQAKVAAADLIIFQFPLWWYSMPAIMKGWVDRVLSYKFAYGVGQWWDAGPFADKRAMLSITTGTPKGAYATDGRNGDIERILWPLEAGVLAICGFQVLPSFVAYGAPWIGDEGRAAQKAQLAALLADVDTIEPRFFHKLAEFGEDLRLRPEVTPRTPGQHRTP
ncbi:NAD(P)H-dependent oxidoreductase [Polymorphobacter sp.]|uniref:NAD(P)H-dependent oxidoreductase n=1 Tax=Polymorphobacter sp. TaxID=1909290 RepID=UPI003F6FE807